MIEPILLGGGKRIFPDDGTARPLQLVNVRHDRHRRAGLHVPPGVVALRRLHVLVCAVDVDVARPERRRLAGAGVVRVAPHAAGVVGQQVDRDRRLGRGRAHAVDVVARREQRVEVAGRERARARRARVAAVVARVDLLVLGAAVEPDEAPREVVVDRRLRRRAARRARTASASGRRRGTAATGRCRRPCRSPGRPPGSSAGSQSGSASSSAKRGRIASHAVAGRARGGDRARTPATNARTTRRVEDVLVAHASEPAAPLEEGEQRRRRRRARCRCRGRRTLPSRRCGGPSSRSSGRRSR